MILALRTDKPEAEIYLLKDQRIVAEKKWQAHRELSATIHKNINDLLEDQKLNLSDLSGVICFEGPGSFTGLRIGLTVGNTLAQQLKIPIAGGRGKDWIKKAQQNLQNNPQKIVLPFYGRDPHITQQKK